jgi:hypothetical protein
MNEEQRAQRLDCLRKLSADRVFALPERRTIEMIEPEDGTNLSPVMQKLALRLMD